MTDKSHPVDKPPLLDREEPTTPDLVELARSLVDATNCRDVEAMMSFFAPDAVWDALGPGDELLRGPTAIRAMLKDWFRPYEEYEAEVEELVDLGCGVVFSAGVNKGRMVGSSAVVQWRQGFVVLYDGDLVVRIASYGDVDEARAAADRLAEERR
jgi:ketosteroid isomerase-like protein